MTNKLDANWQAYQHMLEAGELDHLKGDFVLVRGGKVVATGKSKDEVIQAGGAGGGFVAQVGVTRKIQIRRPRRVRRP